MDNQLVHSEPVNLVTPGKVEPQTIPENKLMESADNININTDEIHPHELRYPEINPSKVHGMKFVDILHLLGPTRR